jgi:hypothetical protein
MKNSTLQKHLQKRFKGIEVFISTEGRLLISAEHGTMIGNLPLADYYDFEMFDPKEVYHEFGVHKQLVKFLDSKGFFPEWENPGVLGIYRI